MKTISIFCKPFMKSELLISLPFTRESGAELDLEIACNYFPGDPGRTYGPPEKCYPPEPAEVEILYCYLAGDTTKQDLFLTFSEMEKDALYEALDQHLAEHYGDYSAPYEY
jgi:hypothetical protein